MHGNSSKSNMPYLQFVAFRFVGVLCAFHFQKNQLSTSFEG